MSLLLLDSLDELLAASPVAQKYTRMLFALLPPGKLWRFAGSLLSALLLGSADELARVEGRAGDLLTESDPSTTVELLPEAAAELDLVDATLSDTETRARVVARTIARQRYRSADFQAALAPLLAQAAADVVVLERSRAFVISIGDDREIVRFFIYRDPALAGTYYLASAQKLVDQIKPSHTVGHVIESVSMLYDDPFSLYDRDLLGA